MLRILPFQCILQIFTGLYSAFFLFYLVHSTLSSLVVNIFPTCLTIYKSAFFIFLMTLRVNSDYFLKQRSQTDLRNGEVLCFLCGTDGIIK
jgi:hypothetical protein